jgi:DNA-binding HxlR family transcriptional regulator
MESGSNFDSSRAELFEALGHPARVRILRSLENGPTGFAQLKREVGIESSGQLQFHLGKLGGLVTTNSEGSYALTDEGREAIRVLKTVPTDFAAPSVRHSAAGRNGWTKSLRVFQVVSVVLLVLIAVFGFAYYSQSTQVSSLNAQVQSLNSEVRSIADLGKSVVLASGVRVSSQCMRTNLGLGITSQGFIVQPIVAFQANYSGYLVVASKDLYNSSEASPYLQLIDNPSSPLAFGNAASPPRITGVYSWKATIIPVSPPGNVTLGLVPVNPFVYPCAIGANATGTFSVTYYY